MKKSNCTEEQIAFALNQAELGAPISELYRKFRDECLNMNWFMSLEDAMQNRALAKGLLRVPFTQC